jgi:DNA primase
MEALIEFIKILVPASVVLYGAYLLVRMFIQKEVSLKTLEVRGKSMQTLLPNRLQAYERMALFLERISPQNLLVRLSTAGMTSKEFHQLLLSEIRNEYNHNVAQQVYMSEEVWNLIKNAKEDLILSINDAAGEMNLESTSLDLSRKIFEKSINKQVDPIAHALTELKKEIQQTF